MTQRHTPEIHAVPHGVLDYLRDRYQGDIALIVIHNGWIPPSHWEDQKISYYMDIEFDDTSDPNDTQYRPITKDQARIIANFIKDVYDRVDHIVCSCVAGLSRSPGVGAAICKKYHLDDNEIYNGTYPNSLVKQLVYEALDN